jgi:hypothetical protein
LAAGRGAAAPAAGGTAAAGLDSPGLGFAGDFACDFKSIGFFCRALAPPLAGGFAGLPAFLLLIPAPVSRNN